MTAIESGEGRRRNEPLLKQMSGGDRIRARLMRADFFEFRPEFKLWLATNHKPAIRGTDLGIWRRIRLIPFTVQIPEAEVDADLPAKLRAEFPGILAWAVRGGLDWQRGGLRPPTVITEATADYRAEQDVLAGFLADCCVTGTNCRVAARDLYAAYAAWCEEGGEHQENQRSFGRRLAERGFTSRKSNSVNWWLGLELSTQPF